MIIVPRNEQALGHGAQHEDRRRRAAEADRLRDDPADDRQGRPDLRARGRQDALELRDAGADAGRADVESTPSSSSRRRRRRRSPSTTRSPSASTRSTSCGIPMGDSMHNVEFVIHRLWRNATLRPADGRGRALARAGERPRVRVDARGSALRLARRRSARSVWDQRLAAEGYSTHDRRASDCLHEIWEFHDGQQVITVLDGMLSGAGRAEPVGQRDDPVSDLPPDRRRRALRRRSPRSSRSSTCSTRSTRSDPSAATPPRSR